MEVDSDSGDSTASESDIMSVFLRYLIRNNSHVRLLTSENGTFSDEENSDDSTVHPAPQPELDLKEPPNKIGGEFMEDVLLNSGHVKKSGCQRPSSVLKMLNQRETGMYGSQHFTKGDCCLISTRFLPNASHVLQRYHHKAFCGSFSSDGQLFLTACQDRRLRLYDTENQNFRLFKTVEARDVGWSILDTALSPDGQHFIYSSWSECIRLCNIYGKNERHLALPLCPEERRFCIFALMFSQDGHEVLGGANDGSLYVYDIAIDTRTLRFPSHEDDVNTVAFADSTSQILFSGGDDGLCKVWDRRMLDECNAKPVGVLAGHRCGITYIDSRGDGRHLITNSKDQSIKLWDMRVFSPAQGVENAKRALSSFVWDYRWQKVPKKLFSKEKLTPFSGDTSLMTYTGHSVLQTLIRCHFSPAATTGQRYIYTGCSTGRLIVYDILTGTKVKELKGHRGCVRDVSWHPYNPDIVTTSWDGSVVRWSYEEDVTGDPDVVVKEDTSQLLDNERQPQKRYNFRSRVAMQIL